MKIAIFHDYFDKKGGGERLIINLARYLKADVYTGFIDKEKTFDTKGIKVISLGIKGPQLYRNIKIAKKFENLKLDGYDAYIFSGVWCISAAKGHHPNVLYLHTPMRILYDLKQNFLEDANPVKRLALNKFIKYWTPKDRAYMSLVDVIAANSENVKRRVKKYYGTRLYKKTKVVYTGIETRKYKWKKDKGFYLSAARLDPVKRIDMIIEAFRKMPDKKLIVAGSGPDEIRLKGLARDSKNILFLGSVSDQKLLDLYSTCKATIAANKDEDLGLIAIESHASGKPIIAIKEGGFLETVKDGKTGVFFRTGKILSAVNKLENIQWNHRYIQGTARKYDIGMFASKILSMIH